MLIVTELFAGLGSQTQALKNIGIEHKSKISEIDKYVIQAYNQLHGDTENLGDITKIESLPYCDLLTYSFPCQSVSIMGKNEGIKQGTSSGLLLEVERLLFQMEPKPKYLLMENVKGLLQQKHLPMFQELQNKLSKYYTNYVQVLNAKDYGIPQNRERVFMVSIRKDLNQFYSFPKKIPLTTKLRDYLEENVSEKYNISEKERKTILNSLSKHYSSIDNDIAITQTASQYTSWNGNYVTRMLTESRTENAKIVRKENMKQGVDFCDRRDKELVIRNDELSNCLTASQSKESLIIDNKIIRRLTPRESLRLMGWKDNQIDLIHDISDHQLYKMAGNGIVVNVLEHIFRKLFIDKNKGFFE